MTTFPVSVYNGFLGDLVAGNLDDTTVLNALLLKDTYLFDPTHLNISAFTAQEATGSGYARFTTSAVFSINPVGNEFQYSLITPAVTFSSFSSTNWRYVIIYKASTSTPYLCVDTLLTNVQVSAGFTLDPGTDPYVRVVVP